LLNLSIRIIHKTTHGFTKDVAHFARHFSAKGLSTLAVPFVILATVLAVKTLHRSQRDSVRPAGGRWALYRTAARFAFPASFSASLFGAFFAMGDQGVAQIMGYHGASSEILIAFAARHVCRPSGVLRFADNANAGAGEVAKSETVDHELSRVHIRWALGILVKSATGLADRYTLATFTSAGENLATA